MSMAFRSLCATAPLLWALTASGASTATDGTALEVNGAFAARVFDAEGGYPALTGGAASGYTVQANPLVATLSNQVSSELSKWLVAPMTGPTPTLALLRVAGGREVDRLVMAKPALAEIEIVNLGAQPKPIGFRVAIVPQSVSVLGGTKGASLPVVSPEPYVVRLIVDDKAVSPVEVTGIGAKLARDAVSGLARTGPSCSEFTAAFEHADIGWLFDWYKTGVLTQGGKANVNPPVRRVEVELAGTKTVVRLASLQGVHIRTFEPFTDTAGLRVKAEFGCTEFTLLPDVFK
jgi:hypothetical protein